MRCTGVNGIYASSWLNETDCFNKEIIGHLEKNWSLLFRAMRLEELFQ